MAQAAAYIPRRQVGQLLSAIRAGDFCYVLTPRQMGKTTLKNAVVAELNKRCGPDEVHAVSVDLDRLCRDTALKELARLSSRGKVFVNVLPGSLADPTWVAGEVGSLLEAVSLRPTDLVIDSGWAGTAGSNLEDIFLDLVAEEAAAPTDAAA